MDHKLEDRTKTVIVEVLFKYGLLKKKDWKGGEIHITSKRIY